MPCKFRVRIQNPVLVEDPGFLLAKNVLKHNFSAFFQEPKRVSLSSECRTGQHSTVYLLSVWN